MRKPLNVADSPLRKQAADTLRRARKLPPGSYRNDLRQLGLNLLYLYKMRTRSNLRPEGCASASR
jgi:hypothetical protein